MTPFEQIGALLQERGERLDLMRRMALVSGAQSALSERHCGDPTLRALVHGCSKCRQTVACANWLATAQEPTHPPEFCRNAIPFRYLASR